MTRENKDMELLSAYIDGELEEADKNRVVSFLAGSPEGRQAIERLKHTKTLLMSTPPVKAPVDFLDALEAQAEAVMEKHATRRMFWRFSNPWAWVSPAMAAAFLFAVGVGLRPAREIPFETLVAAHNTLQANTGLHQKVVAASHYVVPASEDKKNAAI